MKRIILLTLTLLLVVAIAGVVVYAVGIEKNENPPASAASVDEEAKKENVDPETAPAEPDAVNEPEPVPAEPAVVSLEEYWTMLKAEHGGEPFTLEEIYLNCAELFKKEQNVFFMGSTGVQTFANGKPTLVLSEEQQAELAAAQHELNTDFFTKDNKEYVISIDPESVSERDIYIVFLASLENCFAEDMIDLTSRLVDCIIHNYNWFDLRDYVVITIYPGFRDLGFSTCEEYFKAKLKDPELRLDQYIVGCSDMGISASYLKNWSPESLEMIRTEGLYESFKAAAIENGVNIK